jgi:hypothetical protein
MKGVFANKEITKQNLQNQGITNRISAPDQLFGLLDKK